MIGSAIKNKLCIYTLASAIQSEPTQEQPSWKKGLTMQHSIIPVKQVLTVFCHFATQRTLAQNVWKRLTNLVLWSPFVEETYKLFIHL